MSKSLNAKVIAPAYRLLPFATWKEAFDLVVPLYKEYCETYPEQKIVLMGDSAGGGFCVALAEQFKEDGIKLPDEMILLSPWVDITKFFTMLDENSSNELIIGEEMNHVYPLFPIKEAKPAVDKIIQTIKR